MKILITGSRGQLGKKLLINSPHEFKILAPSRLELNLENCNECYSYVLHNKPDFIISANPAINSL